MAGGRDDLYRWKRITSKNRPAPVVTKKSHKPSDDIQDWIKKVEVASDRAAQLTFSDAPIRGQRSNGYSTIEATLDAVHDHDDAYQEAQDLLSQWMAEKCDLDDHVTMDDDDDYLEGAGDGARMSGGRSELGSQWDDMLERTDPTLAPTNKYTSSDALYADIEARDDYSTVQSILGAMLEKEVIEPKEKRKLRVGIDEKKRPDPRTTMAARQQKVKENREKREAERRQQLESRQAKKMAQTQARQLVQQEERDSALRRQREEQGIREEMARIRKEMQERKMVEEEARQRQRAVEAEARRQEDERRRKEEEVQQRIEGARRQQEDEQRRKEGEKRLKEAQEAHRLRNLQSHFQAWYQLVRNQRQQLGKARALSDWRSLLRAWNAWRAFVRACRAEKEAKQTEMHIKLSHRRNLAADNHYRNQLLRKTFAAWQVYRHQESLDKELTQQQSARKSKMAAFLEAAASGKLWTNRSEGDMEELATGTGDPISSRSDPLSRPSTTQDRPEKGATHHSARLPKHAWQITRKHVNLTAEEMASMGDNMDPSMQAVPSIGQPPSAAGNKQGKKPIQYTVNNFEHRYAAQQRLLTEQQEQLMEQRRLIEELQLGQKQQGMKEQLQKIRDGEYVPDVEQHPDGHPLDKLIERNQSARSEDSTGQSTSRTNLSEDSATSSSRTTSRSRQQPPLLKGMEERAAERARLKAEREERHKKREQEKLAALQVEEERKREAEEAEKRAIIEKKREEKRLAKQREVEKQQRLERAQTQLSLAAAHYQRTLLLRYGFKPWRKLRQMARQNMQVAVDHHTNNVLHTCLTSWHQMTQEVIAHKNDLADVKCKEIMLRRSFNSWKRYGHYQSIQLQKARRHYLKQLKARALIGWRDWATDERIRAWQAEEAAEEHNTRRVMKTAFRAWRRYPMMLREERAKEIRRQEMRRKVASIIPDFGFS